MTTIQKVIKIGDSSGVTLPAKQLKLAGVKQGDEVKVTFELVKTDQPDKHTLEVVDIAQKLIKRHETALKNLSKR